MEDCMIEQPCTACDRVYCNCPPEPEQPEFEPLADCPSDCYDCERHVMGCPHAPDYDVPHNWKPDFGAESGSERQAREYQQKYS